MSEVVLNEPQDIELVHMPSVFMRRLDVVHPEIGGNKWYKLKYNMEHARHFEHETLLTFGGAWSNHIYATAKAGQLFGFKTIGIIRGEEPAEWSDTLLFAKNCGMQLEFISRLAYAEKETEDFKGWLYDTYGAFHLIPEGGSNYLGVNGCMEILDEQHEHYDIVTIPAGTGSTAAGVLLKLKSHQQLWVFPALKGGEFMHEEIFKHLRYFLMDDDVCREMMRQVRVITPYHFGGYGKWTDELLRFIEQFEQTTKIPLDQIYTGKMMFGVSDLYHSGDLQGKRVLAIHTGGLQGKTSLINA